MGYSLHQTGQILLVDDDPALLQALPRAISLRLSGVEIATAGSAQAALDLLQHQEYDAIVSDIKMPGMDGLALMEKVYECYPETPVLLITGHGEHSLAIQALKGGAYDYIQKPIDREDFAMTLQRALHTRQLRRQIQEQQRALEQYALSLERQVEQRTHELAAANAAKDRFLSMATRELTSLHANWMVVTQTFTQHLQQIDGVAKLHLADMGYSISRMERFSHELQDASLIQTDHLDLQRDCYDLFAVCQQALDEGRAETGDRVICELPDDRLEAVVDRAKISQALNHLLSNARMYSARGAPIIVTLRRAGEEAIISVRDQGIGIPEQYLLRVYEPFYRVPGIERDAPAGLGLGLYIARAIVEQHGGRMEVQSDPGQGSTFSIVLPLSQDV